jgi:hypothetical protein
MNIEIFKGKPVEKLVEVTANAIGTVYRPTQIRREADAVAYPKPMALKSCDEKIIFEILLPKH